MVYSEHDFNNIKAFVGTEFSYEDIPNTPNLGICVMLNPDQSKIVDHPGTKVDFVQLGEDTLAIRLKPRKNPND